MKPVRAGLFTWPNYQALLEKAQRDLELLRSRPEHPLDVIFNLVTTIDHIWDCVARDDSLPEATRNVAKGLRTSNTAVSVVNRLSVGAKHLSIDQKSPARTESVEMGWGMGQRSLGRRSQLQSGA
jgi:hypothetical protein